MIFYLKSVNLIVRNYVPTIISQEELEINGWENLIAFKLIKSTVDNIALGAYLYIRII